MQSLRYHENRPRGSMDFPLEYHRIDQHHPRYEMPYHWHEEFEILQVRQGFFDLTLNGAPYCLRPGDVAFITSGMLHGGVPHDCEYDCIVFDMRLLLKSNDHCKRQIADILNLELAVQPFFASDDRVIRHTIPPLFDALRAQCSGYELITLGCLFQFLGEVYKHGAYTLSREQPTLTANKVMKLRRVFEMIETEYAHPITLDQMADTLHMSPKYFCRFFKEATHRTPMEYLTYYRVEVAAHEIVSSDKSLTEVALDAGFSSLNYFIRTFKRWKGVTPGQYGREMKK